MTFPDPTGISAVVPIVNAAVTISQRVFELKAVPEQVRDLLETSNQITQTLSYARTLQMQQASKLSASERKWVEEVLVSTECALNSFATLMEPSRVDMQISRDGASISVGTRALFALRDSPKVSTNLSRLNIAVQHLNTVIGVLSSRALAAPSSCGAGKSGTSISSSRTQQSTDAKAPPPTYEESQFLNRRRSALPAESSRSPSFSGSSTSTLCTPPPLPELGLDDSEKLELAMSAASLTRQQLSAAIAAVTGLPEHMDGEQMVAPEREVAGELKAAPESHGTARRRGQAWLAYQARVYDR